MRKEIILMLAVMAVAFAAAPVGITEILEKKYSMVDCRVSLATTLLQKAPDYNISIDTSGNTAKLRSDLTALKSAADSGSRQEFNSAIQTLRTDMKDAVSVLRDVKQQLAKQPKDVKQQARSDFTAAKQAEASCLQASALELAKGEITDWQYWRGKGKETADNLSAKGLDVSGLNGVLSDADAQIATLQGAIDKGDLEALRAAREQMVGEHMHLRARFQIERIRIILGGIKGGAVEKGYQADVNAINSLLDDASARAAKGKPYSDGEYAQTWQEIKDAAGKLRELFKKVRGSS